jgi:zinc protease
MKFSNVLLVFLISALGFSVNAQDLNQPLTIDAKIVKGKLDNGLTYYIKENSKPSKKVELRLVVKVGSIMEDDDQQGLAHMAEHMAFNGTKNFKKNEIVSFLQDIGVGFGSDLNAYTGFDETVYILPIPTDKPGNLEKGFQVLEDWAHQVTYFDEDINNERAIILEESRLGKSGEERMFKKVYPELFKGSKYANRLPIGVDSIIKTFNPNAIRRFYKEWYRPELMAVIVVGDIKPEAAKALVIKHFQGLVNPPNVRKREYADVPAYKSSNTIIVTDKESTGSSFVLQYPAYKASASVTAKDYRQDIIENLYTTLLNSRFREISQKENAPFVFAGAGFDNYATGYKSFNVQTSTGNNDIKKGMESVAEELERVKRYGFTAPELERAKKNVQVSYERAYNNKDKTESDNLTEELIRNFTSGEPIPGIEKEFSMVKELLPTITIAEVNQLTDIYKSQSNRFAYIMGPENKTYPLSTQLLAIIDGKATSDIKPYEEKLVATNLMNSLPKAGKIVSNVKNKILGTTELTLSNGVLVTLKSTDFKADQIIMNATRYGGISGYGLADKFSAENTTSLINTMGVGAFSPTDLKKALAGKTVSVSPFMTDVTDGLRGSSSNKDIESMMQLIYLYTTAARKDSSLFKSFLQRNKAQYAMLGANPQVGFIDTLNQVMYNNNPLAPTAVPKVENFDKISLDRVMAIYQSHLGDMNGMHFNFVGSFKETEILPLIEQYIASLPVSKKPFNFVDNKVRMIKGKKDLLFKKGKEDKSLILAIYGGEMAYNPATALQLSALSEVMNIKIIEDMREKIQGIYGGGTVVKFDKTPFSNFQFVLQLPCGPKKVDTLIKTFVAALDTISMKGIEQQYLDKVKKQWLEEYQTNIKTNEYWLSKLVQLEQGTTIADRFLHYEKYVNQLTISDIKQAAKLVNSSTSKLTAVWIPNIN